MIASGREEGVPGDWEGFQAAYERLAAPTRRRASLPELLPIADALEKLAIQVLAILEAHATGGDRA